ncbi:MAG TPA: hypothetical protein VNH11_35220 [Pirellulales bacterium]|nr:hypothetical protein [Pirellulales bacterium]
METSLHRELKRLYADPANLRMEVRHGHYRIDAVRDGELVEIQHGSLSAIRNKVAALLSDHRVRVVKPIVAAKLLVKRCRKNGRVTERRLSPKRQTLLALFDELVYFTKVFPHPRLTLEAVLVETEEWRYPGHGRRRRWRAGDFVVEDQKLAAVLDSCRLQTPADLRRLLDCELPETWQTVDLAAALDVPRHVAQRIAYCLRETGAAQAIGKSRNAVVYRWPDFTSAGKAA